MIAKTHRQLDDTTWTAAWNEGQAMTLEQGFTCALEK
jgi:hypothetical protein